MDNYLLIYVSSNKAVFISFGMINTMRHNRKHGCSKQTTSSIISKKKYEKYDYESLKHESFIEIRNELHYKLKFFDLKNIHNFKTAY